MTSSTRNGTTPICCIVPVIDPLRRSLSCGGIGSEREPCHGPVAGQVLRECGAPAAESDDGPRCGGSSNERLLSSNTTWASPTGRGPGTIATFTPITRMSRIECDAGTRQRSHEAMARVGQGQHRHQLRGQCRRHLVSARQATPAPWHPTRGQRARSAAATSSPTRTLSRRVPTRLLTYRQKTVDARLSLRPVPFHAHLGLEVVAVNLLFEKRQRGRVEIKSSSHGPGDARRPGGKRR